MCSTYFLLHHLLFGQKHCFFNSWTKKEWGGGIPKNFEIFKLQFDKPPKMGRRRSVTIFFFFIALSKINWILFPAHFVYYTQLHTLFSQQNYVEHRRSHTMSPYCTWMQNQCPLWQHLPCIIISIFNNDMTEVEARWRLWHAFKPNFRQ